MAGARPAARARAPAAGRRRRATTEIKALEASVADELDEAVEAARRLASPHAGPLVDFVVRARPARSGAAPPPPMRRCSGPWTPSARPSKPSSTADDRVFVAGIDVGAGGNVFGLTRGLADRFGDRVRDTPISETAIIGLGVGAAMAGMRPVVEMMYLDFLGVCFDQLLNQAAKLPFMTGGARRDGPHRADPVRRGPLLGKPALPEPRGAAGPHPRADAWSCRRRRPTPTACSVRPSRTRTRSSSSRTGCSTA